MKTIARWIYRVLARLVLKRYKPTVIGIAGSIGKTATKEAIATAISNDERIVRRTIGSFNAEVGVPVTIISGGAARPSWWHWLGVIWQGQKLAFWTKQPYPKYLVLELGADKPGDLADLLKIAQSKIGVLTAIAPEHLEFFGDMDAVTQEESLMITELPADGVAIINADDDLAAAATKQYHGRLITFGWRHDATVRAEHIDINQDSQGRPTGMVIKVAVAGSVVPVGLAGVIGRHQVYPVLAALAVSQALELPLSEAVARLRDYQAPPGRMRLFSGRGNTTIIDDSYNASPVAMDAALETIAALPVRGRKFAVLGQMSELGPTAADWHDRIGCQVATLKFDGLITVGNLAKRIGRAAVTAGLPSDRVSNVDSAAAAATQLLSQMQAGDVVLVKGSRYPKPGYSGFLGQAVELLLAEDDRQKVIGQ